MGKNGTQRRESGSRNLPVGAPLTAANNRFLHLTYLTEMLVFSIAPLSSKVFILLLRRPQHTLGQHNRISSFVADESIDTFPVEPPLSHTSHKA